VANRARPGKAATIVADDQAAMGRRLASAIAAVGVLAAGGLLMAAGPAQAESAVSSQARLTPNPGEWWLADWQVGQKVWPLTQGAGVTVAVLDTGVQASLPDLRGVVRPGGDMTGGGSRGETDIAARGDGHGTAVAALIASAPAPGAAGMTVEDIVTIGAAAICVFVAVLVFVLRISSRRRSGPKNPKRPYDPRMLRDRASPPPERRRRTHRMIDVPIVGAGAPARWWMRSWRETPSTNMRSAA
jgi:hypothetical protein